MELKYFVKAPSSVIGLSLNPHQHWKGRCFYFYWTNYLRYINFNVIIDTFAMFTYVCEMDFWRPHNIIKQTLYLKSFIDFLLSFRAPFISELSFWWKLMKCVIVVHWTHPHPFCKLFFYYNVNSLNLIDSFKNILCPCANIRQLICYRL